MVMAMDMVTLRMGRTARIPDMVFRPKRAIIAGVVTIVIAALAFAQAASSVLTRQQPAIAVQLFPLNGLAVEQLASREFTASVKTREDILPSANAAAATAYRAFGLDPLVPKAIAVLAFGKPDEAAQLPVLDAAVRLNRRDLLLQGLVLEGQVARQDYAGTLETLGSILSVHPAQKAQFFPVLMQALADDAALPALSGILDGADDWRADFLNAASRNAAVVPNLAKLRLSQDSVDPEVDRRLIDGLVAAGQMAQARRIYTAAGGKDDGVLRGTSMLPWTSTLPPFDWQLANDPGFRAQLATGSPELEVFIRGGHGGAIAERLLAMPAGGFTVSVVHSLGPPSQVKDVRLKVRCPGDESPFFDEPFQIKRQEFRIAGVSARCDYVWVTVHGRAWSGSSAIKGNIRELEITPN